jgi:hypothetical protein
MGLGPRIDIRQSQSLVLTPQLTQAFKLLQLMAHHQRLGLADVKAGAESHGHGSSYKAKLSPR